MSAIKVATFLQTLEKTNTLLSELMDELEWDDHERAYHALRVVLHALRDRLTVQEATDLGAQLPMLVRGFYYEGWTLRGKPIKDRKKEQFLEHVADAFRGDRRADPDQITRAVFRVLSSHISSGEIEDVKSNFPPALRELWP